MQVCLTTLWELSSARGALALMGLSPHGGVESRSSGLSGPTTNCEPKSELLACLGAPALAGFLDVFALLSIHAQAS